MTEAERPDPIVYPVGSGHLLISARSGSRVKGLLIRCVLTLLLGGAHLLLRFQPRAAREGEAARGGLRKKLRLIWAD